MEDWQKIDSPPPPPKVRQALYKFNFGRKFVHSLTPSEASDFLERCISVAKRQARQWADAAETAEELLD